MHTYKFGLDYDQKNHECVKKDHGKETLFWNFSFSFLFKGERDWSEKLNVTYFNKNDPCVYVYVGFLENNRNCTCPFGKLTGNYSSRKRKTNFFTCPNPKICGITH